MKISITRILYIPLGLFLKLLELSKDGSRDIHNKSRFRRSKIDNGCCIDRTTLISPHTHLLKNSIINNSYIDSYTYIGKNCIIQNCSIGSFCSIANEVQIGLGIHPIDLLSTSPIFYRRNNPIGITIIKKDVEVVQYKKIIIKNDVWIGTRAIILDGVTIGNGAIIGANAVVTKDIPPYAIVVGSPAKIIRYRFEPNKIKELEESRWWLDSLDKILEKYYN
jgi:acetyltransferase-like isoleucine patch superfamily enzyme